MNRVGILNQTDIFPLRISKRPKLVVDFTKYEVEPPSLNED
jgi:hypothetical protein